MTPTAAVFALAALLLAILGARSIAMMHVARSSWTIAGWAFSTAYCIDAVARLVVHTPELPANGQYVLLGLMTVAFVVAGVRREPQATPWWWPQR